MNQYINVQHILQKELQNEKDDDIPSSTILFGLPDLAAATGSSVDVVTVILSEGS